MDGLETNLLLQLLLPFWHIFRDHVSLRGCVIPLKKGPVFSRSQWPLWALRPRSGPKRFQTSIHWFGKLGLGKGAPTLPLAAAFCWVANQQNMKKLIESLHFGGFFFDTMLILHDIAKIFGECCCCFIEKLVVPHPPKNNSFASAMSALQQAAIV